MIYFLFRYHFLVRRSSEHEFYTHTHMYYVHTHIHIGINVHTHMHMTCTTMKYTHKSQRTHFIDIDLTVNTQIIV